MKKIEFKRIQLFWNTYNILVLFEIFTSNNYNTKCTSNNYKTQSEFSRKDVKMLSGETIVKQLLENYGIFFHSEDVLK